MLLTDEVVIIEAGSEVICSVAEENLVIAVPNVDKVLVLFLAGNIVTVEIDELRVLFANEVVITVSEDVVELEVDIIGVPVLEIGTTLALADNMSPRLMHLLMGVIKSLFS